MVVKIEKNLPKPKKPTTKYTGICEDCNIKFSCTMEDIIVESYGMDTTYYCNCPKCMRKVWVTVWYFGIVSVLVLLSFLSMVVFALWISANK